MKAQLNEMSGRVMEEKKSNISLQAQFEEEQHLRLLAEYRIQELENQLNRSREDTTLIMQRLQRDVEREKQVIFFLRFIV